MTHRFSGFELDEDARTLRHGDREIAVQPRVLDLLILLHRHADRVVTKDELLDALWSDTVVSEGSLQRTVSLARAALREGGAEGLIRTYHGRGYRFCGEADTAPAQDHGADADPPAELAAARAAVADRCWQDAVERFAAADAAAALAAVDLEAWAEAAICAGRPLDATAPLERAVAAHDDAGDRQGAARAALSLARIQFDGGELAVSRGWHARALRFLDGLVLCREHGLWEWFAARLALADGDMDAVIDRAHQAQRLGRGLNDLDLQCLGLLYRGHGHYARGEVAVGRRLLDEAAATVLAGGITGWVGGVVYCGVVWACRNVADWRRAAEWTDQFERWCAAQGMSAYPGTCGLHRAEILNVSGRLAEAERAVLAACEQMATSAPWAEGEAHRVLGDVRRAAGDLDAAEEAYTRAYELGWDPQPGLALVQVARGQADAAVRGLARTLADPDWAGMQRRELLLAHHVVVCAGAGRLEEARASLAELEERAAAERPDALDATGDWARAELLLAEGHGEAAVTHLRRALRIWRDVGSPPNEATLHLRLARVYQELDDAEGAELEIAAAEAQLRKLGVDDPHSRVLRSHRST